MNRNRATSSHSSLEDQGWTTIPMNMSTGRIAELGQTAFTPDAAGTRCLLDLPAVREVAERMRETLIANGVLPRGAVAIQAIAFDKNPAANWKVTWHQDVMFPFSRAVTAPGYDLPSRKADVDYARPPRAVLEALLAVRLHIDDCDETNGPLRVAPGSHREGILRSTEIAGRVAAHGEVVCLARTGEALLMKPLLLHASSPAKEPKHRRVLHVVYHDGSPVAEAWHRTA
ncbi:MAG: phytanoyl-CoA dioxygenase family protein [Burkholderiales bacterium]|nr:phytanoyl-CoA dioxygenase family protein [Opitutaceae bacterium]